MLYSALVGLLAAQASPAEADPPALTGPLAQIAGDWQVVNAETGEVSLTCARAQRFEVAPDGQSVTLTELGNADWSARYLVLFADRRRLLMRIDNEERRAANGEPVRWWAQFDGPDRFRWRRDDWDRGSVAQGVWRRCNQR